VTTSSPVERRTELEALERVALVCTACDLAESRTNVVFGSGAADADVMFVGEGPGQREDELGLPFVGRSGDLLEQLLGEIGLTRSDVYIANVVKCRPPGNRDPQQEEIEACKGYLRAQLELVDPKVVVTLGNFATKLLLRTETGITRLRGVAYEWWGRYLVPTFHPAAALRGGQSKLEDIRYDLALVHKIVDGNLRSEPEAAESPEEAATAPDAEQLGLFGG